MYFEPSQTSEMEFFLKMINNWKPLIIFAKSSSTDVCVDSECASKNLLCREQADPPNIMYCGMIVILQLMKFKLCRLCCAIYTPVVHVQWAYQHQPTMQICWRLEPRVTCQVKTVCKWLFIVQLKQKRSFVEYGKEWIE